VLDQRFSASVLPSCLPSRVKAVRWEMQARAGMHEETMDGRCVKTIDARCEKRAQVSDAKPRVRVTCDDVLQC